MNEVIKISLSGIGFVFDIQAYNELKAYLDRLEAGYKGNPDGPEIIADIEARMVELILSKQNLEHVVSEPLVHEIIEQLGSPYDLGVESGSETDPADNTARQFPRRLYRNPDGAKLGGVCNGIATYFNIDPAWIRLGAFIPLIMLIIFPTIGFHRLNGFLGSLFGALFLLYFIMWIAIPQARTPRQKLEMEGESVTAANIHRKKESNGSAVDGDREPVSVLGQLFMIMGKLIVLFVKIIGLIIGASFGIAALGLLVGLFATIFYPGYVGGLELAEGLEGISARGYTSMVLCVVFIPFFILAYQFIRLILNQRNNRTLMWIMSGIWISLTVWTGVLTLRNRDVLIYNIREAGYSERIYDFIDDYDTAEIVINGDTVKHKGAKVRRGGSTRRINHQGPTRANVILKGDTLLTSGTMEQMDELLKKYQDSSGMSVNIQYDGMSDVFTAHIRDNNPQNQH